MSNWRLGWRFIKGIDILPHYAGGESGVRAAAQKGAILFHKREWPPLDPPRERFRLAVWSLNNLCASGMQLPARGGAAFSVAIRFASASTTRCCAAVGGFAALRMRYTPCGCRSAHLVEVRSNSRLPPVLSMRRAQQCHIPHAVRRQANVTRASR